MKNKGWIIGLSLLALLFIVTASIVVAYELTRYYSRKKSYYTVDLPTLKDSRFSKLNTKDAKDGTVKKEYQDDKGKEEKRPAPHKESETKESRDKSEQRSDTGKIQLVKRVTSTKKRTTSKKSPVKVKTMHLDKNFNSWGEYISEEESQYRALVVDNLKIKSIVIDHLSPGNGVSQEFFKVAYQTKMIPSRILEELVESREFRELIPAKYLKKETALKDIKRGVYIKFEKREVEKLLQVWSKGQLTPIQKAWAVGAE